MRRSILPSFLLLAGSMTAQPIINSSDLQPVVGPSPAIYITNYIPAGPATNGFNYDASDVVLGAASTGQVMLPASTPYGSYYPQANWASTSLTNPQQYGYFNFSATAETNYGYYSPTSHVILTNGEKLSQFPLSLGTTFTDAWSGTGDNSGQSFTRSGNTSGNYNGWGTIQLPFGTFSNVARYEITQIYSDDFAGQMIDYEVNIVSYIKASPALTLFSCTYLLYDFGAGMDTLSTYCTVIDPAVVGIHDVPALGLSAMVYPNPASELVTLELLDTPGASYSAMLLDATGRVVRTIAGANMAFTQRITFDVADLRTGPYFIQLSDGKGRVGTFPLMVN